MKRRNFYKIVYIAVFIFNFIHFSQSFNAVFHFPAKLTYNKDEQIIFTTFQVTPGERMNAIITMQPERDRNNQYRSNYELSFVASSNVSTRSIVVRPNATSEVWDRIATNDVLYSVILVISMTSSNGSDWLREKRVPVTRQRGHIFIQTDRPIYRPNDKVFIRFVPVDDQMKPLNQPMKMTIEAPCSEPNGAHFLSWTKTKAASNKVLTRSFILPDTPPVGSWKVTASFTRDEVVPVQFQTTFHVGDFSLPTFYLEIRPVKDAFILPDDEKYFFEVIARFVYNEDLHGTVAVRIGLLKSSQNGNHLIKSYFLPIKRDFRGRYLGNVSVAELVQGENEIFQSGNRLFIEASVTEKGSGLTRSIRNTDVIFTSFPVVLTLDQTPGYFKPGLKYVVKAEATFINGSAVCNFSVTVEATSRRRNETIDSLSQVVPTDFKGRIQLRFDAPLSATQISITARGQYNPRRRGHLVAAFKEIHRQNSVENEYLQVILASSYSVTNSTTPYRVADVYFTPTPAVKNIVYTVTNGDYFYENQTQAFPNDDHVSIAFPIVSEMSPTSQLAVYYVTLVDSGLSYIVADSAVLVVENVCRGEEILVNVLNERNENIEVLIEGQPHAYIGLTGIDYATQLLHRKSLHHEAGSAMLTRTNMFDVMKSYADGCKVPTTPQAEAAFPSLGKFLLTNTRHNATTATNQLCGLDQATIRTKRTIPFLERANFMGMNYECCAVGAGDVSAVASYNGSYCSERLKSVVAEDDCKREFEKCCHLAESLRNYETDVEFEQGERNTNQQNTSPNISPVRHDRRLLIEPPIADSIVTRSAFKSSSNIFMVDQMNLPLFTSHTLMDNAVVLMRENFDWTWFTADFNLKGNNFLLMNEKSVPSLPPLPDSITTWKIEAFSLSKRHGLCVMEPEKFTSNHEMFIKVLLPKGRVLSGNLYSIEVIVYSYFPQEITVNVSLKVGKEICKNSNPPHQSRTMQAADGRIASSASLRFNILPILAGQHRVDVIMKAQNEATRYSDTVVKTLKVEEEGNSQKKIEWVILENKRSDRRRSPVLVKQIEIHPLFPADSVPGSENAVLRFHSGTSALLREPAFVPDDGSSNTIAQYLYTLQYIISKFKISRNYLTEDESEGLTAKAQTAYDGLLRYVCMIKSSKLENPNLYGFSYSPCGQSKPNLWLTSVTLQTIFRITKLVLIKPDGNLLKGSLMWILSHQNKGRNGYFADKPFAPSRKSMRETKLRESLKRNRRQSNGPGRGMFNFNSRVDKKVYRTAVVAGFLNSILKSIDPDPQQESMEGIPEVFELINVKTLKNSFRRAVRYIGITIKQRRTEISPLTLAAALRAMYMSSNNSRKSLEKVLYQYKQEENNRQWIQSNDNIDTNQPLQIQDLQRKSADIEATSYTLQLETMKGSNGSNYVNWLLQQRKPNNYWMTLGDSIAAMIALENFLQQSNSNESSIMRIDVTAANMQPSTMFISANDQDSMITNAVNLPTSSNSVVISVSGIGTARAEVDLTYNQIGNNTHARVESDLCPFTVSVRMRTPDDVEKLHSFFPHKRSSSSSSLLNVTISVRYKYWYNNETNGETFIVDFGLLSRYVPLSHDLDKLSNTIEKVIDHYRVSERALLLYMSEERDISFILIDRKKDVSVDTLPISIYTAANPERRCTFHHDPPHSPARLITICSREENRQSDECLCVAANSCPKIMSRAKSAKITTHQRLKWTNRPSTKYVYRVLIDGRREVGSDWWRYDAQVQRTYSSSFNQSAENGLSYSFWLRKSCGDYKYKFSTGNYYLIFGKSVVQTEDGLLKHLLNSDVRIEHWPSGDNINCQGSIGKAETVCRKLWHYQFCRETVHC